MRSNTLRRASALAASVVALAALLNAFAYTLVVANPLVQSDLWRMLDGFLGRFIDHGFSWADVFVEPYASDTNLPLYKLMLFANVRWFALDLRLEAVAAVLAAACTAWLMARYAAGDAGRASTHRAWLLAVLSLVVLSLNAWNNYAWSLALAWHVPLLLSVGYFCFVRRARWPGLMMATLVLGILLDEFAYPAVAAALIARGLSGSDDRRRLAMAAAGMAAGIVLSRAFYGLWEWTSPAPLTGADAAVEMTRSLRGLPWERAWKAIVFPLTDAVVHVDNLAPLFGRAAGFVRWGLAAGLLAAHAWFWWTVVSISRSRRGDAASYLATATMLLAYAMVAAVVLQRVPQQGFDYLHQPRYVLFYQLHLAALVLLAYRRLGERTGGAKASAGSVEAGVLVLAILQGGLSILAWTHARGASIYYERIAADMGNVARAPASLHACEAVVRVCTFPEPQRRRIMARLVGQRLNLFAPRFQAMHRLRPVAVEAQPPAGR